MLALNKNKKILLISFAYILLIMHRVIGPLPQLSVTYSIVATIVITLFFVLQNPTRVYIPMAILLIYIPLTLSFLIIPNIFRPWERFAMFAIFMMFFSPIIQNERIRLFRDFCLKMCITICIITSTISFFCYFLNINYAKYEAEIAYRELGGLFSGILNHSIVLGTVSGISVCALTYLGIIKQSRISWLIIPCLCSLFFSASRGALFACLGSSLAMLFSMYRDNQHSKRIKRFLLIILPLIILAITQTSIAIGFEQKLERDEGEVLSSRNEKIEYRIKEFKQSPIIGIGFAAIDPSLGDDYNPETGVIEPGSSWFAILSMIGSIGFTIFLYIIYQCFKNILHAKCDKKYLLIGLLFFISIAMFSEGYIFAAGHPLCIILWLILGQCVDIKYKHKQYEF